MVAVKEVAVRAGCGGGCGGVYYLEQHMAAEAQDRVPYPQRDRHWQRVDEHTQEPPV